MCFVWNAGGLRLCETLSQAKADASRKGFKWTNRSKCVAPDFFVDMRNTILAERPNLVVVTTEDENNKETYFHAELMPRDLSEHGYSLIKRDVLNDVGEVAGGVKYDTLSGTPSGSSLRISIYARDDEVPKLQISDMPNVYGGKQGQLGLFYKVTHSGAIASYLWHETFGKFVFVAVKLTTGTVFDNYGSSYEESRSAIDNSNRGSLLGIVERLINKPNPPELVPDHVFLMGDFNSNIVASGNTNDVIVNELVKAPNATTFSKLLSYDELTKSLANFPLKGYSEGLGGSKAGPLFLPTWKLRRGRERCEIVGATGTISPGCFDATNGIGWHDRILIKDKVDSRYSMTCTRYDRFDIKNMHQSNQAGVIGVYILK